MEDLIREIIPREELAVNPRYHGAVITGEPETVRQFHAGNWLHHKANHNIGGLTPED